MDKETTKNQTERNQFEMQEEYLKSLESIAEGNVIEGKVVSVDSDFVFIDVGYKSEGKIPLNEFAEAPKIGDCVHVILINRENREGELVISKRQAELKLHWKMLQNASQNHEPVSGVISKSIKGGFEVNLGYDIIAFLPMSKADIGKIEKPEELVQVKSKFFIERFSSDKKVNIIVSRRSWLEKEITQNQEIFYQHVQIGDIVEGNIKSFTSFGAFIDLGGFDGLLHINDISWGHTKSPKDILKKGDKIRLIVVDLDKENKKVNLSLKHFTDDPWNHFEEKYKVGTVINGTVTKLVDFGAFIEIEPGIEGLAHISELSWISKIKHPKEILKVGDNVEAKILGYDLQKTRISLGLKQLMANPWDDIPSKYPVGMRLTRKVIKIIPNGAFIEIESGIDAFLHIDEISWTKKIKNINEEITEEQEIEVMILSLDKDKHQIHVGIKQLSEDPWDSLSKAYSRGSVIEGEISGINDFGLFCKVQGCIEGLISKTMINTNPDETNEEAMAHYKIGDRVKATIIEINPKKQKLALSIKDYIMQQQKQEIAKYIHEEEDTEGKVTLGDFMKVKEK